jgi:hypothetical protein
MTTPTEDDVKAKEEFGAAARAMASHCHKCGICAFADRKPQSLFGRLIRWHHTWCPCWAAHTKVYGQKSAS